MKLCPAIRICLTVGILCAAVFLACTACGTASGTTETNTVSATTIAYTPNPLELTVGVGAPLPQGGDYLPDLPEGWTATAEELAEYRLGEQNVTLTVTGSDGSVQTCSAVLFLVKDTEGPVIHGLHDIAVNLGDAVAYRKGVTVSDNCYGSITLDVQTNEVHTERAGDYPVVYRATDACGNVTELTAYVHVYADAFDEQMLWALVSQKCSELYLRNRSTVDQCRTIYTYVNGTIMYTGMSDKTDWKREAYRAMTEENGDCFSYFAVSKAFFEYLGIETLDVQRTEEATSVGKSRHYWALVNIAAAGESAQWYHFDACRMLTSVGYPHSGCLLTDAQLEAYSSVRTNDDGVAGYFYVYDRSAYPTVATEIITETPELDPLMK